VITLSDSIKDNKLTGDYKIAYFDILTYLGNANIPIGSKFSIEVREDMKDMLLSAQKNHLSVNSIIGNDIKKFCEDIVKTHNTNRTKLLEMLKRLNLFLAFLMLVSLLFQIVTGSINLTIIIVFFLTWFLYKYILNFFCTGLCLKFKGLRNQIICIILIGVIGMLVLFPLCLLISKYFNLEINGFFTATICLLFILVIQTVCKK
jgi:DNA-binding ferritin-like protein (Dps family)